MKVDVLIFGGGGAGLWLLNELHRGGWSVLLLERHALGAGQTIASQGIIHGGIKYTLAGAVTESARAIRRMPGVWRECLAGRGEPDLSATRVLSDCFYLWGTGSIKSKLGLVGARAGLRTVPTRVDARDRPKPLANCSGDLFRVDEQVIDCASLIHNLAEKHAPRTLKLEEADELAFDVSSDGRVRAVRIASAVGHAPIELHPKHVVFAAGAGNADLRARVGLSASRAQLRPLHMVLVRGALPMLFAHCVDGVSAKPRVTITSAIDREGRTIWQIGGGIAEIGRGVRMEQDALIDFTRRELATLLPTIALTKTKWSTYRIDRAESSTEGLLRPAGPVALREGNVITAWPTKLALLPALARLVVDQIGEPPSGDTDCDGGATADWPRPLIALPPWEVTRSWHLLD